MKNKSKEVVDYLIHTGVDLSAKDQDGRTPVSYAKEGGDTWFVERLREA